MSAIPFVPQSSRGPPVAVTGPGGRFLCSVPHARSPNSTSGSGAVIHSSSNDSAFRAGFASVVQCAVCSKSQYVLSVELGRVR